MLSRLANKVSGTRRYNPTFLGLMDTILNFAITFYKDCSESFVATRIMDIAKDIMRSDLLTGVSAQIYRRKIHVSSIILKQNGSFALVKSLNGENSGRKPPDISCFVDLGLCTATTYELLLLIRVADNFMDNPKKPAPYTRLHCMLADKCFQEIRRLCLSISIRTIAGSKLRA